MSLNPIQLFKAATEEEKRLENVIKSSPNKAERTKALKALRKLNGADPNDGLTIWAKEVRQRIPGKPKFFNTFYSATIFYNREKINRP